MRSAAVQLTASVGRPLPLHLPAQVANDGVGLRDVPVLIHIAVAGGKAGKEGQREWGGKGSTAGAGGREWHGARTAQAAIQGGCHAGSPVDPLQSTCAHTANHSTRPHADRLAWVRTYRGHWAKGYLPRSAFISA